MSIFDKIIAGTLPASFVWQDERCVAFMDINPITPGHVLVVPRQGVQHLAELDDATRGHLFNVATRIAEAQRRSPIRCDDVNVVVNDGRAANQTVPHVHVHVIPRSRGDSRRVLLYLLKHVARMLGHRVSDAMRQRLDAQAKQIAAEMGPR